MAAVDETSGNDKVRWRRGTLSDEEFDCAAAAFRPSWEQGLMAAGRTSVAPYPLATDIAAPTVRFTAPTNALQGVLADNAPADPSSVETDPPVLEIGPSVVLAEALVEPPSQPPAPVTPAVRTGPITLPPPIARPRANSFPYPDVTPPPRSRGLIFASVGMGIAAVIGLTVALWGGHGSSTQQASLPSTVGDPTSVSPPAPPEAPPPAPIPAPSPAPVAMAPAPAPAPVVQAPEPPVQAPVVTAPTVQPTIASDEHPAVGETTPRVRTIVRRTRGGSGNGRPGSSQGGGVQGAGFVTDNPY